jgi:hypothetical protein
VVHDGAVTLTGLCLQAKIVRVALIFGARSFAKNFREMQPYQFAVEQLYRVVRE